LNLETAAFGDAEAASTLSFVRLQTRGGYMKVTRRILGVLALCGLIAALAGPVFAQGAAAASNEQTFTVVAEQINKSKFWFPSNIMVQQGDKVKLILKNEIEGADVTHGFTLPAYGITEVVTRGVPKTVTFTADKPGIFHYWCQLHPAHIGGELLVVPKGQ
jgi:heme/copper-type cytochrome/quinol oxidase subunit 2